MLTVNEISATAKIRLATGILYLGAKRGRKSILDKVDDFTRDFVRRTVHNQHDEGLYPTAKRIHAQCKKELSQEEYPINNCGLLIKLLHLMDFSFRMENKIIEFKYKGDLPGVSTFKFNQL